MQEGDEFLAGVLFPAIHRNAPVANVSAEDEFVGPIVLEPREEALRLAHGNAAYGHHVGTGSEGLFEVVVALDASTEVDDQTRVLGNSTESLHVDDMFGTGSVEVYHMESCEPHAFKRACHLNGVVVVGGLPGVVALGESYAFAVDDVDGGNQFYHCRVCFLLCRNVDLGITDALSR